MAASTSRRPYFLPTISLTLRCLLALFFGASDIGLASFVWLGRLGFALAAAFFILSQIQPGAWPMATDFHVKRGDSLPNLVADLTDGAGVAVDLTSVTTKTLILRHDGTGATISRTAVVVGLATAGRLQYAWVAGDWTGASAIAVGTYRVEIELIYSTGQKLTVPTVGHLSLVVYEDLG